MTLEQQAIDLIHQATITPEEWVHRIRYGYKGRPYAVTGTNYYKALKLLRQSSPAPSAGSAIQNVIYCAQRSEEALHAPFKFKVALTADPTYAAWATPGIVAQFRAQGRKVYAWGVQTQIPAQTIRDLANRLNLDGCIFQGETSEEYRTAIAAGATMIVGNANSWTSEQRADAIARCNAGTLAFAQEAYTNLGGPWPESTSSGGVPAASLVIGVDDDNRPPRVSEYKAHTPPNVWATISVYHAAGVNQSEWGLLA